jgi:transcriptional regulator with XRE-family HTH domain
MIDRVEDRRIRIGLSLRALAKELEVSPSLLSLVLNGTARVKRGIYGSTYCSSDPQD